MSCSIVPAPGTTERDQRLLQPSLPRGTRNAEPRPRPAGNGDGLFPDLAANRVMRAAQVLSQLRVQPLDRFDDAAVKPAAAPDSSHTQPHA